MTTYSNRQNCIRAARKMLGSDAVAGLDFRVFETNDGRFDFEIAAHKSSAETEAPASAPEPVADPEPVATATDDAPKPKRQPKAKAAASDKPRKVSKADQAIEMLKRPEGATIPELCDAFGWLAHSARALLSVETRKRGLAVEKAKNEGRGTVYKVAA